MTDLLRDLTRAIRAIMPSVETAEHTEHVYRQACFDCIEAITAALGVSEELLMVDSGSVGAKANRARNPQICTSSESSANNEEERV